MKPFPTKAVVFVSLSALAVWMGHRCRSWHTDGQTLVARLLQNDAAPAASPSAAKQSWGDLPPAVKEYFRRTFSLKEEATDTSPFSLFTPRIRSLKFHQQGKFRIKEGGDWLTLAAEQTVVAFPATNSGFLWEAEMPLLQGSWPGAIHVRDAWVDGEAILRASLAGIFTLASEPSKKSNEEALLQGEMMRWLTEAFLYPTALLPESGLVEWKYLDTPDQTVETTHSGKKVRLCMKDPYHHDTTKEGVNIDVDVIFKDNDTIVVEGKRSAAEDGGFVMRSWIGVLSRFAFVPGASTGSPQIRVPMHMEGGWKNTDDDIFYYFVGDNHNLQIDWFGVSVNDESATTSVS